jgi:hypothetical protein
MPVIVERITVIFPAIDNAKNIQIKDPDGRTHAVRRLGMGRRLENNSRPILRSARVLTVMFSQDLNSASHQFWR